jgi:hypothetical protein
VHFSRHDVLTAFVGSLVLAAGVAQTYLGALNIEIWCSSSCGSSVWDIVFLSGIGTVVATPFAFARADGREQWPSRGASALGIAVGGLLIVALADQALNQPTSGPPRPFVLAGWPVIVAATALAVAARRTSPHALRTRVGAAAAIALVASPALAVEGVDSKWLGLWIALAGVIPFAAIADRLLPGPRATSA